MNTRIGKVFSFFMSKKVRRPISVILAFVMFVTSISFSFPEETAYASEVPDAFTTIYFRDDTESGWIGNNNAVIQAVDNTNGHDYYTMKKEDSRTWSLRIRAKAYNFTFNRLSPDKKKQWNSWSAGGRGSNRNDYSTWKSTYHATVPEHGYWDGKPSVTYDYFKEGDVVYLDFYEFTDENGGFNWEKGNAVFYVNFTEYSKKDNKGNDIKISEADKEKLVPIRLSDSPETQVFRYVVTKEDEGATELRFFRGNDEYLWNDSVMMKYSDYKAGNNCVKVKGWNDTGYVCPYVPRRHIPQIDSVSVITTGNKKVNRKIDIDLDIQGEVEYLLMDETTLDINKIDSDGNVIATMDEVCMVDDSKTTNTHRELLFKESGTYRINAMVTDGYDEFPAEEIITIVDDEAPVAGFEMTAVEGEAADDYKFVRNSNGQADIKITDGSVSELGDYIIYKNYKLYYDENNDGNFDETEVIDTHDYDLDALNEISDELAFTYELSNVGKYKITLDIQEKFDDTILSLIDESVFLKGQIEKEFEIVNQAPTSAMKIEKNKMADIIFTIGSAGSDELSDYAAESAKVKEFLKENGIDARVTTVETSSLNATDTFAWKEYDHYNYKDRYLPTLDKHIIYDGKDIKMLGYSYDALKDFLYVEDNSASKKIFDFDLQRDKTDWHSMEGGGFLFNTAVNDEENYLQGYCVLVTQMGLKIVQINRTKLDVFRETRSGNVERYGKCLKTFNIKNLYANHHFRIIVDKNTITVYDDGELLVNEYVLPDDGVDAYGYGPIISHGSHCCSQQSYFTFKNITMQTVTGKSLSDVINEHEWLPGTNHYVINLSGEVIPELSEDGKTSDVAAALMSNDVMFFGIGNDKSIDSYNRLLNIIDGFGENIQLTQKAEDEEISEDDITVVKAVNQIVSRIKNDVLSKDYKIYETITTDEPVSYSDTYSDPENDEVGTDEWKYEYDSSVFNEGNGTHDEFVTNEPVTLFENSGAYKITHIVSDDPTHGNENLKDYIKYADTDEYKKLILAHNRPVADMSINLMQSTDGKKCIVNVAYDSSDADHPSDSQKGIREEKFYYKELNETAWTEGRFPSEVEMGKIYIVKYVSKDIEGAYSRPCVRTINTNDARVYVKPEDNTAPEVTLIVSKTLLEVGEEFSVEAYAEDDNGVSDFVIKCNDEVVSNNYGRFIVTANEACKLNVTVTATDLSGNVSSKSEEVTVIDNTDKTPPEIIIDSPKDGSISGDTDIVGTIKDNKALDSYTITKSKLNVETNEESDVEVVKTSNEEVIEDVIDTINVDSLEEGYYKYTITAKDKAGLSSTVYMVITVRKEVKDRIPPECAIETISLDSENDEVVITASVSDNEKLEGYNLTLYRKDNEDSKTVLVSGTEAIDHSEIASISTSDLSDGEYILELYAWDSEENSCISRGGFTYEAGSSENVVKRNDDITPPVIAGNIKASTDDKGLHISLNGSITDDNLKEYNVITGKKNDDGVVENEVLIKKGNTSIIDSDIASYTYGEILPGDYVVYVTAEDGAGNMTRASYIVTVTKNGTIDDKKNNGGGGSNIEEDNKYYGDLNLTLSTTATDAGNVVYGYITFPKNAKNVSVTSDRGEVSLNGRIATINNSEPGLLTVTLSAEIDGEIKKVEKSVRYYDKSDKNAPVAELISPEPDSDLGIKTDIVGTVKDEEGLAYYVLEYKLNGTENYTELAKGYNNIENVTLATLDKTMLMNGSYSIRLTAVDNGGNIVRTERCVNVNGDLKVGNMAIGFTDINTNVAGIPLSVTRNYDSRNKASGDFGTGWTLGLNSVKLTESHDIATGYEMVQSGIAFSTKYEMVETYSHDITVSYGDGTCDRFKVSFSPQRRALVPIYDVNLNFVCVTNKKVKLELEGSNYALVYNNFLLFDNFEMSENHSYILTKEDGTKLYISPKYGLTKAVDTNGNTITVSKNGFKHSNGMGIDFTRDKNGRITKATEKDKDGNEIDSMSYVYDENDNLIMNIDKAGRNVTYTYDNNHNLIDIIDPSGIAVARNEYDDEGRLVATIDADGNRTEYEHDVDSKTEVIRDRMGNPTVYTYDDNGNILKTVDALGNVTTNTYDKNNNKLSSTDANGNTTYFKYDSDNNLKSLTTADGTVEELTYNELNTVTDIKFAGKNMASMNYDSKGNLTKAEDSLGNSTEFTYEKDGKLSSVADEIGTVHKLKYDTDGNLISMEDGNGNTTKYDYDENGRCVGVTVARTNENGNKEEYTSRYVYDVAGNVISEISNSGVVTTYEYDYRNNKTAEITADGIRTNYEYDNQSNLTKITYSDGTFEEFTYDKNGNNITARDRMGVTVTMTYDKINRLIKKTFADGSSEDYKYDANGNIISVTNVEGGVIKYSYDSMNRNTKIEDAYGNISKFEYNERSLLTKFTDALGNVFEYEYDLNGNQTGLLYPDGTKEKLVYDARNRVVKKIDRENHETSYIYNGVDLLTEVIDACGNSYKYEYDETNELVKVTDAKGNETKYVYDADGRVTKLVNAAGKTAEYTYDSYGKVVGYKDYKGNQNTYVYDENGYLTRFSCSDGNTDFTYDDFGRLSKVNDSHGEIAYTYDDFGRMSSKKTYDLGLTKYTYTSSDDIKSVTHNVNGVDVAGTTYDYDLMDRVVRVVAHDGVATLYEYDAIGNRTLVKHEGGLSVRYRYDVCSRVINQTVTDKDSNVLMYYDYSYGDAGERTKTVEVVRNSADDANARIISYQYKYDELLRLEKEVISIKEDIAFDDVITSDADGKVVLSKFNAFAGSITNEYEYDSVSNRTSKNTVIAGDVDGYADEIKEGTTSYTYNELNQLLSARTAEDESVDYSYDDNGNLISESGSITKAYTYSSQNKLLTATISEGSNVTIESYEYDYEGNRISKQTGEEDKVYYLNDTYDELTQVALELKKVYNSDGDECLNVSKYYTRGTELLSTDIVGTNEAGEVSVNKKHYIQDVHGSVTALVQNTSENSVVICDTYTYDAYGNLLKKTGNTDNDYLYTGEQYNESTGLYYLRARYMNPQTGTFISMDSYAGTLDNPVSLHKYLYANANPVMNTDPSGYFSLAECSVAQSINNILSATRAYLDIKRIMSWVNMAVTAYDVGVQIRAVLCGEASILDVALAVAKGMVTQALISCFAKAIVGEAATYLLKVFGVVSDVDELVDAIKAKDPEKIIIASLRIALDIFTFSCQCFTEDTLVETTDGSKKISDVKAGDEIYAYNIQNGENEVCKVKDVSVTKTDTLVHVKLSDGSEIKTTMYHPFFVENGKDEAWVAASNLEKGDKLHSIDERELFVEEVIVEKLSERIEVYNLEIDGLHTYYAGSVLVHNRCKLGENMKKQGGDPGADYDAHHILPQKFREFFQKAGIDIDSPEYGIWVQHNEHRAGSRSYNALWERQISIWKKNNSGTKADIIAFINSLERLW